MSEGQGLILARLWAWQKHPRSDSPSGQGRGRESRWNSQSDFLWHRFLNSCLLGCCSSILTFLSVCLCFCLCMYHTFKSFWLVIEVNCTLWYCTLHYCTVLYCTEQRWEKMVTSGKYCMHSMKFFQHFVRYFNGDLW